MDTTPDPVNQFPRAVAAVLAAVQWYARFSGACYAHTPTIAARAGFSVRHTLKALRVLRESGALREIPNPNDRRRTLRIPVAEPQSSRPEGAERARKGRESVDPPTPPYKEGSIEVAEAHAAAIFKISMPTPAELNAECGPETAAALAEAQAKADREGKPVGWPYVVTVARAKAARAAAGQDQPVIRPRRPSERGQAPPPPPAPEPPAAPLTDREKADLAAEWSRPDRPSWQRRMAEGWLREMAQPAAHEKGRPGHLRKPPTAPEIELTPAPNPLYGQIINTSNGTRDQGLTPPKRGDQWSGRGSNPQPQHCEYEGFPCGDPETKRSISNAALSDEKPRENGLSASTPARDEAEEPQKAPEPAPIPRPERRTYHPARIPTPQSLRVLGAARDLAARGEPTDDASVGKVLNLHRVTVQNHRKTLTQAGYDYPFQHRSWTHGAPQAILRVLTVARDRAARGLPVDDVAMGTALGLRAKTIREYRFQLGAQGHEWPDPEMSPRRVQRRIEALQRIAPRDPEGEIERFRTWTAQRAHAERADAERLAARAERTGGAA